MVGSTAAPGCQTARPRTTTAPGKRCCEPSDNASPKSTWPTCSRSVTNRPLPMRPSPTWPGSPSSKPAVTDLPSIELADTTREFAARIDAMARDAIAQLQPGTADPIRDAQAIAVTTFLAGVLTRLAGGDQSINDVERLARLLAAIAAAVANEGVDDGRR